MRGSDKRSGELFSYVDLDQRVRRDHPLRAMRPLTDVALAALSGDFAALYSGVGRPSIAPEMLLHERVTLRDDDAAPRRDRRKRVVAADPVWAERGGVASRTLSDRRRCGPYRLRRTSTSRST